MATLLSTIIADARVELKETTAKFWTDAELLAHAQKGVDDLWGAIVDLGQDHFLTVDTTNVSIAANTESLTGVPTDVFKVRIIEPKDTTSNGTAPDVIFVPRDYQSHEFRNARQLTAQDPSNGLIVYYHMSAAGAPVGAPTVLIAPQLSSALTLRFAYTPTSGSDALTTGSNNPIPGASDHALMAWVIAHARAKEREDRSPDPNWLAVYSTDKQNLLVRLTPRQEQEPEVVDDFFGAFI